MKSIIRLISILPKNLKKSLIFLFFFMVVLAFLEILSIGSVLPVVGILTDKSFVNENEYLSYFFNLFSISNKDYYIYFALLTLLFLYTLKSILGIILTYQKYKIAYRTRVDLSSKLLEFYIRQDYEDYTKRGSYILINNILKEIPFFVEGIITPLITLFIEAITFIFIFILLLYYEPYGTFSILLLVLVYIFLYILIFSKRISTQGKVRSENEQLVSSHIVQSINGMKEIKLWGKEDFFLKKFTGSSLKISSSQTQLGTFQELPRLATEVIGISIICLLASLFIYQGQEFSEVMVKLGFFAAAGLRIMPSINRLMGSYQLIKFYHPVTNKLYEEFTNAKEIITEKNKTTFKGLQTFNNIKFDKVSFKYDVNKNYIFKDINLNIKKGDVIGILGKSGSGKSTFVDLLTSLLNPTDGKILIDGSEVKAISSDWKKIIGYVPQNIFMSDTTIKKNIAFALNDNEIDIKTLNECVEKAQINEFLGRLPDGLDTHVGEKGSKLSGGQIQRVAIARCLYKRSQIMIFDESTNALDMETENKILDTIFALKKNKTIFIVSHKLNALKYCDKIYKVDNGKIIEE